MLSLPLGVVETEDASDGLTETDVVGVGEEVTLFLNLLIGDSLFYWWRIILNC